MGSEDKVIIVAQGKARTFDADDRSLLDALTEIGVPVGSANVSVVDEERGSQPVDDVTVSLRDFRGRQIMITVKAENA